MTAFPITSLLTAVSAVALVLLSLPIANRRRKTRLSFGDGEDEGMRRLIRTQGNFIEYVPLILIAIGLLESAGESATVLWALGGGAALGRVLHAIGLLTGATAPRALGMVLTFLVLLGSAGLLVMSACAV